MPVGPVSSGTIVRIAPEYAKRKWSDASITPHTLLTIVSYKHYSGEKYPSFKFEGRTIELSGLFLEEVNQ